MWQPISTIPLWEMVLVYCPKVNRGTPGCEVLMRGGWDKDSGWWTNGGPNGGSDLDFFQGEEPTAWMPLPSFPEE